MASSGKITVIGASSPATISTDLGSMSMLLSFLTTPTLNEASSADSYLSLPLNETVMVARPSPTATNESSTILTTDSSLEA